jgi:excisionase family DNA binding protein
VGVQTRNDDRSSARRLTVTVEEAATMLGISRTAAYGCVTRGEITTVRLGRRLVVPLGPLMMMLGEPPSPAGPSGKAA